MSYTYTTNWQDVTDGSSVEYNPQNLVQRNGRIEILDAEGQWRGKSVTNYDTEYDNKTNSDTASAYTQTISKENTNTDSGTTGYDTNINSDTRTINVTESGQYGNSSGAISTSMPAIPSTSGDIKPQQITVDYYIDEDTGGSDTNIVVEWDDDPFNRINYDSSTTLDIDQYEKKRVGGFTTNINTLQEWRNMDGAQIRFDKVGDRYGTAGLVIELEVEYIVETIEQDVSTRRIDVEYPDTPTGYNFDRHIIREYIDGSLENTTNTSRNKSGDLYTTDSPKPTQGSTKTIEIITRGEKRTTVSQTASVQYPEPKSGWKFRRHEVIKYEDGDQISSETVYDDSSGEHESKVSTNPSSSVGVEITTYFSKTTKNISQTLNPQVDVACSYDELNIDDVVFAIDSSGSANEIKQHNIAQSVLDKLPDSTTASLVEFDFNANELVAPDLLEHNRDSMSNSINSITSSGGTEISSGLSLAADILPSDGTIILITDGHSSDDVIPTATDIGDLGIQIVSIMVDGDESQLMQEIASVSDGYYFENDIDIDTGSFGITLTEGELSNWIDLCDIIRTNQTFNFFISDNGGAEFRWRFEWKFDTPEPVYGSVGFRDNSDGIWREAALADPDDNVLEYNHVMVYNDETGEWGALDVVDTSNEIAIDSHQFYDEDVGWLAPRQYDTT